MNLSDIIRENIHKNKDGVLAPIIENLQKYLAKELEEREEAYIRWFYKPEEEEVNKNHAFVYYTRRVALLAWLTEQGFRYRHVNYGINVYL